jgi:nuclear transport factor 2 (NTF2) superfamily protein
MTLAAAQEMEQDRPPLPPFVSVNDALTKVRAAEDAWNSRDPELVSMAYTPDCVWRNRTEFLQGRSEVTAFLRRKWAKELQYRLVKELWGFRENRMAVRFAYEWCDGTGRWFRSYGNELWEFAPNGQMHTRIASINDLAIREEERRFNWPLGPRPANHPGFTGLR